MHTICVPVTLMRHINQITLLESHDDTVQQDQVMSCYITNMAGEVIFALISHPSPLFSNPDGW